MTRLIGMVLVAALGLAWPAAAQQELDAARIYLGLTGTTCTLHAASGAPSSGLGAVCDVYHRTDSPYTIYVKTGASTWSEVYRQSGTDVAVTDGGTGLSAWTTGDLVYASGTTTLAGIADVGAGSVLVSNSGVPGWSATPSVTTLTASGAISGFTLAATTSVSAANVTASGTGAFVLASGTNPYVEANGTSAYIRATGTDSYILSDAVQPTYKWYESDQSSGSRRWDAMVNAAALSFRVLDDAESTTATWLKATRSSTTITNIVVDSGTGALLTPDYASQTTGWAITRAGSADVRYLYTDELHARTFIADLEQALAGLQIITKSVALLNSAFTCPNAGATATLAVKDLPSADDMQVFDTSDWVSLRSFSRASQTLTIGDCVGQVSSPDTAPAGYQTWTFTRGSGGSAGSVTGGTVISPDGVVLDYGVSGNGYYEVNAVDGIDAVNSPYSQVVTWATAPVSANRTVQTRIGNLAGTHGYSAGTPVWGAVFGPSAASHITIDPTNGVRVRTGSTTKIQLSAAGNASFLEGNTTLDETGVTIQPTTALSDSRAYKFTVADGRLGTFAYDGTDEGRYAAVVSNWTGVGDHPSTLFAALSAAHAPSSGGTPSGAGVTVSANGSAASVNISTSYNSVAGAGSITLDGVTTVTGSITERSRSAPMGDGIAVSYSSGNFTSDSGSWSVESGDVATNRYTLIGHTLLWTVYVGSTSTTGSPTELRLTLPGGFTANVSGQSRAGYVNLNGSVVNDVYASISSGSAVIAIKRDNGSSFGAVTNGIYIGVQISVEVQ